MLEAEAEAKVMKQLVMALVVLVAVVMEVRRRMVVQMELMVSEEEAVVQVREEGQAVMAEMEELF
jgi:cytidylate kinase